MYVFVVPLAGGSSVYSARRAGRPITVAPLSNGSAFASGTAGPSRPVRKQRVPASRPSRRPAPTDSSALCENPASYGGAPSHEPSHRQASSTAPSGPLRRGQWPHQRLRQPEAGRSDPGTGSTVTSGFATRGKLRDNAYVSLQSGRKAHYFADREPGCSGPVGISRARQH